MYLAVRVAASIKAEVVCGFAGNSMSHYTLIWLKVKSNFNLNYMK